MSYWVQVAGRKYFLRITDRVRVRDMVFERMLLDHLSRAELPVPRLLENVAKGTFTPWSTRGRFVSLFEHIDGRELGVFELRPSHTQQVGRFLGRMHLAARDFSREKSCEVELVVLKKQLERLERAVDAKRLARDVAADVRLIGTELERLELRGFERLPRGVVHGDLGIERVKWRDGKLMGVIDFQTAASHRLTWDIATSLNAWCWEPTVEQHGGPAGRFDPARVRALLEGYESVRSLRTDEVDALADDLRFVALRRALHRLVEYELRPGAVERRGFRDYRHDLRRLARLVEEGGAAGLIAAARRD